MCISIYLSNLYPSSSNMPTETMPKVVHVFDENQPVTSIVNTIRVLLNSRPVGNDIWIALAWCAGIMIVAYLFAMRVYTNGKHLNVCRH